MTKQNHHNKQPFKNIREKNSNATRFLLYGKHTVIAALHNINRIISQAYITKTFLKSHPEVTAIRANLQFEMLSSSDLAKLLPSDAVHQGIAIECKQLPELSLEEFLSFNLGNQNSCLVILDQITDPHNIGAIMRSCAAFNVSALITTERHTPGETSTLAKTASGSFEVSPFIKVTNLVAAIGELKKYGYWVIGLGLDTKQTIATIDLPHRCVFILGAEGSGMRRLTSEKCDFVVKLPMSNKIDSLNVSNAAAIALYEYYKKFY
jgi:23S rRNA (guanosine2251-2'-O)-methyltransferase